MADGTGRFFDQEASDYRARSNQLARAYRGAAEIIAERVSGHTVCIGGLWPGANTMTVPADLTIVDLSSKMAEIWAGYGAKFILADARDLPIENGAVDTIVYPMMLHHVCDGTAASARQGVRQVFREARRVLAPNGQLLILDFTISRWVYVAELALAPAMRQLLALKRIPLVIMHTSQFYANALAEADFTVTEIPTNENSRALDLVQPVIGLPWLRVPRFIVPLSPLLIAARN